MAPIPKATRGYKFTVSEVEHLLETVEDVIPIENPNWECTWQEHSARCPTRERTAESLKRKFQELARKKVPTGDPKCPPKVHDGSTGGSDGEVDFGKTGTESRGCTGEFHK